MTYPNVILLTGQARSGKDLAAKSLTDRGWVRVAFADPLKQMAVAVNPWVQVVEEDINRLLAGSVELVINETIRKVNSGDLSGSFFRLADLVKLLGWEEAKKIADVRLLLQRLGTEGVRQIIGNNTWVYLALEKVYDLTKSGKKVVVTDCRFPNEAAELRSETSFFACVYRIVREGSGAGNHVSEAGIPDELVDGVIDNNGSVESLQKRILELAGESA